MKHANDLINGELTEGRDRLNIMTEEKQNMTEQSNKLKAQLKAALEDVESMSTWKRETETEVGEVRNMKYQFERNLESLREENSMLREYIQKTMD